jgi:hypothetical protein
MSVTYPAGTSIATRVPPVLQNRHQFGTSRGGLTWTQRQDRGGISSDDGPGGAVVGPIAVAGSNTAMLKRTLASALSGSLFDLHLGSGDADRSTRTKRINAASLDEVLTIFIGAVDACTTDSAVAPPLILMDVVPHDDTQVHEALARLPIACIVSRHPESRRRSA